MGNFKISSQLFQGVAELKRLQRSLDEWGYKRHELVNTRQFGLAKDFSFPDLGQINREDCFYVEKAGTPVDEIKINIGVAVNSSANLIINKAIQNLQIPNDGQWYWVKIAHKFSNDEVGTVSVDTLGNLTGLGTEFTSILRGQPNFPSKIRFLNSTSGNGNDYEVTKVISNTQAIIQGDFINETNLKFAIVGTFTPGYVVPSPDQLIFNYDDVDINLVQEITLNTRPAFIADQEFYIARVRNTGLTLQVEDKRVEWFMSQAEHLVTYVNRTTHINPLIGVEAVKFTDENTTRDKNAIIFAWGFRFSSYTIDTSSKKISILIGEGGVFKDTSFFTAGDFTQWRLYSINGNYQTIIDSQKSGTQIILTLDTLDIDEYGISDELFVAPPFEEIEIRFREDGAIIDTGDVDGDSDTVESFPYPIIESSFKFNINTPTGKCEISTLSDCYLFNVNFRYKTLFGYTDWIALPSNVIGYYNETSFDKYGNLKPNIIDRTLVPYVGHMTNGFIKVCPAPDSYQVFQDLVLTGDLFGVEHTSVSNAFPQMSLYIGTNRQYQMFDDTGFTLPLTADIFIILKSTKNDNLTTLKNGNNFLIHFKQKIQAGTFKVRIVYNFINPTSYTLLKEFTSKDFDFLNTSEQGLRFRCTYDGTIVSGGNNKWLIDNVNETKYLVDSSDELLLPTQSTNSTSFIDMTGLTFTTPNDGISRKYLFLFKGIMKQVASSGDGVSVRIYNNTLTAALDNSKSYLDVTAGNVDLNENVIYCQKFTTTPLAPNTVIKVQFNSINGGNMQMDDNSFIVLEQN